VNTDVRPSLSPDGGAGWSEPVKVNNDAGPSDPFQAQMAVRPDGLAG
jgi:hypothetical protein